MDSKLTGWENQDKPCFEDIYKEGVKQIVQPFQVHTTPIKNNINIANKIKKKQHYIPKVLFKSSSKYFEKRRIQVLNMTSFCKNTPNQFSTEKQLIKKNESKQNINEKQNKIKILKNKDEKHQPKLSVVNVFEKIILKQKPKNKRIEATKKVMNFYRSKQKRIKSYTSHSTEIQNKFNYTPKLLTTSKHAYSVPTSILYNILSCQLQHNKAFYQRFPLIKSFEKYSSYHKDRKLN